MASDKMLGSFDQKSAPEDNDLLVEYDAAASKVKNVKFGGVWNWIVKKLTSAVINELQTSSKNVVGAINELNSKTVIGTTFGNGVKEIELVPLSCGLLSFSHPYDGCALYLFSTFYDASAGHIYSIKENSRINSVTLNGNKLIMNTSINFTFCCYVYTYR